MRDPVRAMLQTITLFFQMPLIERELNRINRLIESHTIESIEQAHNALIILGRSYDPHHPFVRGGIINLKRRFYDEVSVELLSLILDGKLEEAKVLLDHSARWLPEKKASLAELYDEELKRHVISISDTSS